MSQRELERQLTTAYDTYADAIFRHCYFRLGDREQGKEVMQDAFMKAWEYLVDGKPVEDLKAFLYRIANNLVVDTARRRSKRTEQSFEDMHEAGFDVASDEDATKQTQQGFTAAQVTNLLQQIPTEYRAAVIMRYIDDLTPAQIAEALDVSANVASVRINRGMKQLRSLLKAS